MRVVVTGGAGFIGARVVRRALENQAVDEVVVLDDASTGLLSSITSTRAEFVFGSILDDQLVRRVVESADAVIHLAAIPGVPPSLQDPIRTHHANTTGTLFVLEAARATGAYVIVASSSSVYGANPAVPATETAWTRPLSPYGVSKLATEGYAAAYQSAFGLPTLAFRFFNVYGPGQRADHGYAAVIPRFIQAALAGESVPIEGDGLQSRDFTYVDTVARVLVEATVRRVTSQSPVNLAFGTNVSVVDLVGAIARATRSTLSTRNLPPRPGDVRTSQADPTLLKQLFPSIRPVDLTEGLEETVHWFRSQ
jgi:UDP-glucose 4-epimerase